MNKKLLLSAACFTLLSSTTLIAQNWKVAGNPLTTTGKLGSTSNFPIDFISNNIVRGRLTAEGRWGLGTSFPAAKLHVNSAAGEEAFRVQVNGTTKFLVNSSGGVAIGAFTAPATGLCIFGNAGIGITTPKSDLHVQHFSSGVNPIANTTLTLESSSNNYLSMLTPSASESGILFGNPSNAASGGIIYNSSFGGSAPNALQFRTNGNITRMILKDNGFGGSAKLGINTINPAVETEIVHGQNNGFFQNGFRIHHISQFANTMWTFYTETNGDLKLFTDINSFQLKGVFNGVSGIYTPVSDIRSKKDIEKAPEVLNKVLELDVKKYHFLENKTEDKKYYGMIAQEVEKIFPEVVYHNKSERGSNDYYTMDYSAFGVIAIKAIQELVKITDEKDAKIDNLQKQIDELKATFQQSVASGQLSENQQHQTLNNKLSNAYLEQNTPNPFTNSTTIRYTLPQKFTTAQIVITDNNGKTMKQENISGAGKGILNVDAATLSSGTYNYSLIVDGKLISTKQMVLTK